VLAVCPADLGTAIGGEVGNTCWPAPEVPNNENKTQIGNLGLRTIRNLPSWHSCVR
jgi:hypothetical protein